MVIHNFGWFLSYSMRMGLEEEAWFMGDGLPGQVRNEQISDRIRYHRALSKRICLNSWMRMTVCSCRYRFTHTNERLPLGVVVDRQILVAPRDRDTFAFVRSMDGSHALVGSWAVPTFRMNETVRRVLVVEDHHRFRVQAPG